MLEIRLRLRLAFILLALTALAGIGCSDGTNPGVDSLADTIYLRGDLDSAQSLLRESPGKLRTELDQKLSSLLHRKILEPEKNTQGYLESIDWWMALPDTARVLQTLSFKRRIYAGWSTAETRTKLAIDSLFRNFQKNEISSISDVQIDRADSLILEYLNLGDSLMAASVNYELATQFYSSAMYDSAGSRCRRALSASQSLSDFGLTGDCFLLYAKLFQEVDGNYLGADTCFANALKNYSVVGKQERLPLVQLGQGVNYMQLGIPEEAVECFTRSIPFYQSKAAMPRQSDCLYYLTEAYFNLGDYDSSIAFAEKVIRIGEETENINCIRNAGNAYSCRAMIRHARHEMTEARKDFSKASEILRQTQDEIGICINNIRTASLYLDLEQFDSAFALCEYVLAHSDRFEERVFALYESGIAAYRMGDRALAHKLIDSCLSLIEGGRSLVNTSEFAVGYLSDKTGPFEFKVRIFSDEYNRLADPQLVDSAFAYMERSRALVMRDLIAEAVTDNSSTLAPQTAHQDRLRPATPQAPLLDKSDALLEYSCSHSGTILGYRSGAVRKLIDLKITGDSLQLLVNTLAELVTKPPQSELPDATIDRICRELFNSLVAPALQREKVSRLIISPSGILEKLPFALLIGGSGKYLIEDYDVLYWPSCQIAELLARRQNPSSESTEAIIIADPEIEDKMSPQASAREAFLKLPPLPFSIREGEAVTERLSSSKTIILTGAEASEVAIKNTNWSKVRYLHLATHSIADARQPSQSAVLLSYDAGSGDDGLWNAREIANTKLRTDNVYLSVCSSASGRQLAGEGVLSLARYFLIAGSQSAVATLWNVNDRSSAIVAAEFYCQLVQGKSKSSALAAAQKSMLASERKLYRHPYYWAAFVLIGKD